MLKQRNNKRTGGHKLNGKIFLDLAEMQSVSEGNGHKLINPQDQLSIWCFRWEFRARVRANYSQRCSRLEQGNRVRRKEQRRPSAMDWPQPLAPIPLPWCLWWGIKLIFPQVLRVTVSSCDFPKKWSPCPCLNLWAFSSYFLPLCCWRREWRSGWMGVQPRSTHHSCQKGK